MLPRDMLSAAVASFFQADKAYCMVLIPASFTRPVSYSFCCDECLSQMDIPAPFSLIPKAALKTVGDAAMTVTLGIIMASMHGALSLSHSPEPQTFRSWHVPGFVCDLSRASHCSHPLPLLLPHSPLSLTSSLRTTTNGRALSLAQLRGGFEAGIIMNVGRSCSNDAYVQQQHIRLLQRNLSQVHNLHITQPVSISYLV